MAFLDWMKERNASQQQPVAQSQQPETPVARSVESLPDHVKAQAVEAARPAAELMEKATSPKNEPVQPQPTPNTIGRGRSLGMER